MSSLELTQQNCSLKYKHETRNPHYLKSAVTAGALEYYDICIVIDKSSDRCYSADQVCAILHRSLRARVADKIENLESSYQFHDVYGLKHTTFHSMRKSELQSLIEDCLIKVLEHLRVEYDVERVSKTRKLIKCRLSEKGAQSVAAYVKYPLQCDKDTCPHAEYLGNEEYYAPYVAYTPSLEERCERAIYQRYDLLSRVVDLGKYYVTGSNEYMNPMEHGSLFRDVDRIRLLYAGLFEFINLELLCDKFGMIDAWFSLKQPVLEDTLNAPALNCVPAHLEDWRNYFGEYVTIHTYWYSYLCRQMIWPGCVLSALYILHHLFPVSTAEWHHYHIPVLGLIYATFLIIWSTMAICKWIREERLMCLRWGQIETGNSTDDDCPYFKDKRYQKDPVRANHYVRDERKVSHSAKIVFCYILSFLIFAITAASFVFIFDELMKEAQDEDRVFRIGKYGTRFSWLRYVEISAIYIVVAAKISSYIYEQYIVEPLVRFENHVSLQDLKKSKDFKLFIYRIALNVVAVGCLWRMTLLKDPHVHNNTSANKFMTHSINIQILMFHVIDIAIRYTRVCILLLSDKFAREAPECKKIPILRQFNEREYLKLSQSVRLDKLIEFANVSMFSVASPLLPLISLGSSFVDMLINRHLLRVSRRPYPQGANGSLGINNVSASYWNELLHSISFLSIISNVLFCMLSTPLHESTVTRKLTALLIFLVVGLGLKDFIEYKLPACSAKYNLLKSQMDLHLHRALWLSRNSKNAP